MKPVVIVPPAPQRWPALEDLFHNENRAFLDDLRIRVAEGVPGAHDAFAIAPEDAHHLGGCFGIGRCGDVGIVRPALVRPERRRRGLARQLFEAVAAWFEMTGGRWLYLFATAELDEAVYGRFHFQPLHRAFWQPHARLAMLRCFGHAAPTPYDGSPAGPPAVRPLTRADAPAMIALLQHRMGPDPRVPLEESAVAAEVFVLDLLAHQDRGAGLLLGEWFGGRLFAFGSAGLDRTGARTYALLVPHDYVGELLRPALEQATRERGYEQVDFPMEKLADWHHGAWQATPPPAVTDHRPPPMPPAPAED
ncbi:MAG: GNAT family N-acetyltransferase [Phycisphaerales bacterium]|nr:GNAT family N-acetyltransferase [Phycisphaerales bacterium]